MTDARVLFVRHGAHAVVGERLCGRTPGFSLSDLGRRQAEALAERLARDAPRAVYTSPVTRAQETASVIAAASGLEPVVAEAIDEIDFGAWAGRTFAELDAEPAWRLWNADRARRRPPGGESMAETQARVASWLDDVRDDHAGAAVVAVSHADVIKAAVAYALGLSLHFYDRFEIAPGSLTTLVHGDAGWTLSSINEAPHG